MREWEVIRRVNRPYDRGLGVEFRIAAMGARVGDPRERRSYRVSVTVWKCEFYFSVVRIG